MTKEEREIRAMNDDELLDAFESNVDQQAYDIGRYLRVTQKTKKRYDAIRCEIIRRMNHEDNSKRQEVSDIR